jgi:hypothetical protein
MMGHAAWMPSFPLFYCAPTGETDSKANSVNAEMIFISSPSIDFRFFSCPIVSSKVLERNKNVVPLLASPCGRAISH